MTKYKCLKSFTSSKGTRYKDGEIVPSYNYNALSYGEQRNFTIVEDGFFNGIVGVTITNAIVDTVIDSFSSDSNDSDSSSSSSSFDFGGGDSGGAGAGGDY